MDPIPIDTFDHAHPVHRLIMAAGDAAEKPELRLSIIHDLKDKLPHMQPLEVGMSIRLALRIRREPRSISRTDGRSAEPKGEGPCDAEAALPASQCGTAPL